MLGDALIIIDEFSQEKVFFPARTLGLCLPHRVSLAFVSTVDEQRRPPILLTAGSASARPCRNKPLSDPGTTRGGRIPRKRQHPTEVHTASDRSRCCRRQALDHFDHCPVAPTLHLHPTARHDHRAGLHSGLRCCALHFLNQWMALVGRLQDDPQPVT